MQKRAVCIRTIQQEAHSPELCLSDVQVRKAALPISEEDIRVLLEASYDNRRGRWL